MCRGEQEGILVFLAITFDQAAILIHNLTVIIVYKVQLGTRITTHSTGKMLRIQICVLPVTGNCWK